MLANTKNIFLNFWQFRFRNPETELDYQKMRDDKLKKYKKIILCSLLLKSVCCSVFNSFFIEYFNTSNVTKYNFISCYFTTVLYLILLLFGWNSNKTRYLRWILYLIYFFKAIFINSTRNIIITCSNIDIVFLHLAYFLELNCRMMWATYYLLSTYELLVLNFFSLAAIFSIVPYISPREINLKGLEDLKTYVFILTFISSFCFVLERQLRISFYYSWEAEKKAKWLSNVLNNMNSGFVSLKCDKIAFINIFLLKYLKNFKLNNKLPTSKNGFRVNNLLQQEIIKSKIIIL